MPKADSSRIQISVLKQTGFKDIPSEAFKAIRHTGGSFGAPQETNRSNAIRGDAQRGGAVRVGLNPEATINMELTAKTFDDLIEGLMRSTWSSEVNVVDTGITADSQGSKFTSTSWTGENIEEGMWVHVSGFANAGANGWFKVMSIDGADLNVIPAPADDTNTEANEIQVQGSYIRNGAETPYYALQLEHLDLDNKIRLIKDARIGVMNLSVDSRSIVTGSIQAVGTNYELPASRAGDGEIVDAPDVEILNTSDHLKGVFINDELFDAEVMSFSLTANMNPRRQNALGKVTSADVGMGSLDASGSLSIYLTDATWDDMLLKYKDFTKFRIAFALEDSEGNGYVFELPRIVLSNEPGNIPGPDNDVMLSLDFSGEPGTVGNQSKTLQICKRSN